MTEERENYRLQYKWLITQLIETNTLFFD